MTFFLLEYDKLLKKILIHRFIIRKGSIHMVKKADVLFANDQEISEKPHLKQFIERDEKSYSMTMLNERLTIIISESKTSPKLDDIRMVAGSVARELGKRRVETAHMSATRLQETYANFTAEESITAFVEGWHLGSYQFMTYKTKANHFQTALEFSDAVAYADAIKQGQTRAEAVMFSRDLMNELSNVLNPETFPNVLQEKFAHTDVEVTVHDQAAIEEMEMNGVLTVARGSEYKPNFVELTYCTDPSKPLVALVGKGVTFDTGGISLKGGRNISDMRMDMGGAAAVSGAMQLLVESEAQVNVVALIPMVENMPDGKAVLPGEVIRYKNNHTVQIGNTDAEGRLILADGLIRAGELKANYIVDIATLTGAIVSALGSKVAGVFGDEQLSIEMKQLGDKNGEFNWPMPLVDAYDSYLNSDYADFSNISNKGEAGAITAGLFLRKFVPENSKWLHVDMAGLMESQENGYYAKSATGFGARLLADYAVHVSQK